MAAHPRHSLRLLPAALLVLALALAAPGARGETLTIDADQQFQFAGQYFQEGEYFKAVAEFERFCHFFPDDPRVPEAMEAMGRAYLFGERWADAVAAFGRLFQQFPDSPAARRSRILLCEAYIRAGDHSNGANCLTTLARLDPAEADRANYSLGFLFVDEGEWDKAREAFSRIVDRQALDVDRIDDALARADEFPRKSPTAAGILAVVPGLGHVYTGRYEDAAIAFFLNGGLILGSVECFNEDLPAVGALLAVAATGFYAGNIYGAVGSAHKYNKRARERFIENVNNMRRPTLSLEAGPTTGGFYALVRVPMDFF